MKCQMNEKEFQAMNKPQTYRLYSAGDLLAWIGLGDICTQTLAYSTATRDLSFYVTLQSNHAD